MKRGEIWIVEFPANLGYEQVGTRPVIILANTEANIAVVIPFTSNIQALRFPHTFEVRPSKNNGLSAVSIALLFQIRAIDKKRLKKQVGMLEPAVMKRIDPMLKTLLQL